jgi:toxin ParE1/3/4
VPSLIVQPRAQLDIDDALTWYSPRNPALVPRFLAELDSILTASRRIPRSFRLRPTQFNQRALLRKFPFSVFFIVGGDLAAIVAVLHQKRRPVNWKRRSTAG